MNQNLRAKFGLKQKTINSLHKRVDEKRTEIAHIQSLKIELDYYAQLEKEAYVKEKTITTDNFYQNTIATFSHANEPIKKLDFVSESGSVYWYMPKGVYRTSTHWNYISNCFWGFCSQNGDIEIDEDNLVYKRGEPIIVCGFCAWNKFKFLKNENSWSRD